MRHFKDGARPKTPEKNGNQGLESRKFGYKPKGKKPRREGIKTLWGVLFTWTGGELCGLKEGGDGVGEPGIWLTGIGYYGEDSTTTGGLNIYKTRGVTVKK